MYSLWFLTATLATGAAAEPPTGVYTVQPAQEAVTEPAPRLGERLRNLLYRAPPAATPVYATPASVQMPAASPYAATVVPAVSPCAPAQPVAVPPLAQETVTLSAKAEDQIGHEIDYSWITGHLAFVRTAGGRWVVRYAPLGQVDRYGGSVVLAPTVDMRNFREGDVVRVHGEVLDEGRAVHGLGGALYRVNAIFMIDRASPER